VKRWTSAKPENDAGRPRNAVGQRGTSALRLLPIPVPTQGSEPGRNRGQNRARNRVVAALALPLVPAG